MKLLNYSLMIISACLFIVIAGCDNKSNDSTPTPAPEPAACANKYSTEIAFEGPGGHSNGAYGRVNAVHAAGTAIDYMLSSANQPEGVTYTVTSFKGGNSVNSIAYDANVTIEACADEASQLETFKTFVKESMDYGVATENAFRNVTAGETDTNGVRIDVRYTIK